MDILKLFCIVVFILMLNRGGLSHNDFKRQNDDTEFTGNRNLESTFISAELKGDLSTHMYYYIDVLVGTYSSGSSIQSLIIDTGSSITLFPGAPHCQDGGTHLHNYYSINGSSSSSLVAYNSTKGDKESLSYVSLSEEIGTFRQSYKEGSMYEGFYVTDKVRFTEDDAIENNSVTFGGAAMETGLFKTQKVDGVMGLGRGSSTRYFPTFNQQLYENKVVDNPMFALGYGFRGGAIMFGGFDTLLRYSENSIVQWFPIVNDHSYSIELDRLYVGNVHIPHVPRVGLIDSGSSWVITSFEEMQHIEQAFEQFCQAKSDELRGQGIRLANENRGYKYDTTRNMSLRSFFASFPTITFTTVGGGRLNWYPSEYFEQRIGTNVFGIQIMSSSKINEIVLGASFLRQNLVVFDPDQKQVAFMRAKGDPEKEGNSSEFLESPSSKLFDISNSRVTTLTFNDNENFMSIECMQCDVIQEEINVILFFAIGLVVLMLLAIGSIVMVEVYKRLRQNSKVDYTPYTEDSIECYGDSHNTSKDNDRIGFIGHEDDEEF